MDKTDNSMHITGKTKILGIFGDPVSHSLSPQMQNAAIKASGFDACYVPFRVTPPRLCDAITAIRALGLHGINLTIPHKEAACDFVDEIDPHAKLVGAINTIVNRNGTLVGFNTDGQGLINSLGRDFGMTAKGKKVLLVGAGGACRAAVVALCKSGAKWVGIANRTPERGHGLVESLELTFPGTTFAVYPLSMSLMNLCPEPVDILINTSAVGLAGESFGFNLFDCVKPGGFVYDMVYSNQPTPLLDEASRAGYSTANGLGMLAGQGEAAFELWFGVPPKHGVMRTSLRLKA